MAELYVASMRQLQPSGPYYIAAMCARSSIALEMCHRLVEAVEPVGRLILLDPPSAPPRIKDQRGPKAEEAAKSRAGGAVELGLALFGRTGARATEEVASRRKHHDKPQNVEGTVKFLMEVLDGVSPDQKRIRPRDADEDCKAAPPGIQQPRAASLYRDGRDPRQWVEGAKDYRSGDILAAASWRHRPSSLR